MKKPLITLTSDFGVQSRGIGSMEATILDISPDVNVVHLAHGLPDYDIVSASRVMESIAYLPIGYHICVVDPGVGTERKGIIIKTKRGDYLIGPDNGVLISTAKILGEYEKVVRISNLKYMRQPVSPVFHGRDVFSPAAAYLSKGIVIEEFGDELKFEELVKAPYDEAVVKDGQIEAQVIFINKYGSIVLNILSSVWDELSIKGNQILILDFQGKKVELPFVETYGKVDKNKPLILKEDYGRIEVAINLGNFSKTYGIKMGDKCLIKKKS